MSRRTVVVLVAVAAATFAYAASAAHTRATSSSLTIYSHATKLSLVDVDGDKAPSPGDQAITTFVDYTRQGGSVLGSGTAVCTLVSRPSLLECTGSDAVPGGRVFEACTIAKSMVCTVTGGTGAYRFMKGEAVAKPLDKEGKNLLVTFSLSGS
jgi:hypothetical protein